jgi:sugar lactone lactonase YvrE
LYAFDPATGCFESLGAQAWADEFDVKIHRTLLLNPKDRNLYFATSLLHDIDRQREAPGGKLVRWDPANGQHHVIATPFPHLYVQSIAADWERSLIYCFTYPAEFLVKVDLLTGKPEVLGYLGNSLLFAQPHNAVVDGAGWLWGTCAETRAFDEVPSPVPIRLFRYHPDGDRFDWFEHGLSRRSQREQLLPEAGAGDAAIPEEQETRHKDDYGFCDAMVYDGDGAIYAGTTAGVLCRIDCASGSVTKVANAVPPGRFPALAFRDGILYGGGGLRGNTQLIRWDTRTDRIDSFRDLIDPRTGERPARIHEIAVDAGHRLYLGENDNHTRSSYLWKIELTS